MERSLFPLILCCCALFSVVEFVFLPVTTEARMAAATSPSATNANHLNRSTGMNHSTEFPPQIEFYFQSSQSTKFFIIHLLLQFSSCVDWSSWSWAIVDQGADEKNEIKGININSFSSPSMSKDSYPPCPPPRLLVAILNLMHQIWLCSKQSSRK